MKKAVQLPEKKLFFISKMISLGAFCHSFLQAENTEAYGQWILRFKREIIQSLQKQCNNYPKIHSQTKRGAVVPSPPPLNTPLVVCDECSCLFTNFMPRRTPAVI